VGFLQTQAGLNRGGEKENPSRKKVDKGDAERRKEVRRTLRTPYQEGDFVPCMGGSQNKNGHIIQCDVSGRRKLKPGKNAQAFPYRGSKEN